MNHHPYKSLPDHAFWSRSIERLPMADVDPVVAAPFTVRPEHKVATAGSCFAQHIARYLKDSGFNYYVVEAGHPITPPELAKSYNYGVFSARYGNLYTSRQLLQLFLRAYGEYVPATDVWAGPHGSLLDPFRPTIQPDGFASRQEFDADRERHFAQVRRMFETLDVFVFTLGLTECWIDSFDGAVFPLCPGVAGGEFDAGRHRFLNLSVTDIERDMLDFIDRLRRVNPRARLILTVSPVPLIATAEPRHVLVSTTYSKSVLRVAAEQLTRSRPDVAYFPSFEIITGNFNRGAYYAEDFRSVREEGVRHVMGLFMKHYAGLDLGAAAAPTAVAQASPDAHLARMADLVAVNCDEARLDVPHLSAVPIPPPELPSKMGLPQSLVGAGSDMVQALAVVKARLLPPPPPWKVAVERLLEGLPRRPFVPRCVPLQQLSQVVGADERWLSIGDDPAFLLEFPAGNLPRGWVYLEAALHRTMGNRVAMLHIDRGLGFEPQNAEFVPSNLRGSVRELVFIPADAVALRWDPCEAPGYFSQSPLVFHEVGRLERWLRMADRVTSQRHLLKQTMSEGHAPRWQGVQHAYCQLKVRKRREADESYEHLPAGQAGLQQ